MKINTHPSPKDVRYFVLLWALFAGAAGGLLFWRHHPMAAQIAWMAAALVGCLGMAIFPLGRGFYRVWMSFACGMNFLVTRLLLTLIFWGVLTPIALVFRLWGRDAIRLKKSSFTRDSYWLEHDKAPDLVSYRHLY